MLTRYLENHWLGIALLILSGFLLYIGRRTWLGRLGAGDMACFALGGLLFSEGGFTLHRHIEWFEAFFAIMARWKVRDEDARALLGGVSNGPFYEMKRRPDRVLETDRLTRVSFLIGIYKALHILHSDALADEWIQRSNSNPIFAGETPLAYLVRGGLPAMQTGRRLLDSRRAG